ncbi:MAG: putative Serine/threonine-protein kinase STE20 [Streblomastix strix]|uniref:Putative Serine/threonine-protein kinase STE20 n=1 Tax=Streblomastix strix TaxID=222440 RepID=A0A5J4VAX6_9EUKA|nr:MAG: putative Serine/threonine-protein kinase STE20 [Streblomastix strix]
MIKIANFHGMGILSVKLQLIACGSDQFAKHFDVSEGKQLREVELPDKELKHALNLHQLIFEVSVGSTGEGSFGCVFLVFDYEDDKIVAVKIFQKEKYDSKELDAVEQLLQNKIQSIFVVKYLQYNIWELYPWLSMEYANMKTLDIIAKQPEILLPSYIIRALMKQILEGMRVFHSSGLVHRDIKCDNILLHSPPGSGHVHVKISDFGFAKKVDLNNKQTYLAGTIPFMSPEQFLENPIITQKVDIYALGITFYKLITHKYPVNERNLKEQGKKMSQLKSINRPSEMKDNLLLDLLSRLLEFDPNKRITATEALQHPYFTSPEALADISKEQQDLASLAAVAELKGDSSITEFDKDPTFIVSESVIKN